MKITWIEHSSFLLELPERVLVLDYFGKSRLPLPANKPVTFLASHHHADHYDKAILEHGTDQIWYCLLYTSESILLGKGIGYGQKPGNVIAQRQENQVFLPVDNARSRQIVELVNSLPVAIMELAQDIVIDAQQRLKTPLGENLVFVLADHLNFALERIRTGMVITNRVFWEIKSFYPQEFEAGLHAVEQVRQRLGCLLYTSRPRDKS